MLTVKVEHLGSLDVGATLYKDSNYSLKYLVEDIKLKNLALPDIQRPFVWSATKTRDLLDSMYRGYPVGTLMFWETGVSVGTRQVGGGTSDKVAKLLIVDGQQRLTALYAVLTGEKVLNKKFEKQRIRIAFRPSDESFQVTDAAIERDPEYVSDITALWGDINDEIRTFLSRLSESHGEDLEQAYKDLLSDRIRKVRELENFGFQVIELTAAADEEQVAEIFVRINSEGVQLNQADFILTLMSVHWEKGRVALEEFSRAAVDPTVTGPSPRNPFIDPSPDLLLRAAVGFGFKRGRLSHVFNLLRGKDLETGIVSEDRRTKQFEQLQGAQKQVLDLTNWQEFLKCLTHAGFRSSRMITSNYNLIYTYLIWLIGRCDFGLEFATLRPVIARWFFMSQTTARYTGSSESQIESDLARIKLLPPGDGAAFCAELDRLINANFTGDYWEISLPNRLDTSSARSPALMSYWAALALLDADLLFSTSKVRDQLDPAVTAPRSIERHHLFPKAFLNSKGVKATHQVNALANMAFLDWPENAAIAADDPLEYWPRFSQAVDEDRLKRQIYWHALPIGWEQLEYADFLAKRQQLIAKVIRDGFETLRTVDGNAPVTSSLRDLIDLGESQTCEFKSTARWNLNTGAADKKMEQVIVKTVCGFMNAEGGSLLVGVDDDGVALGLAKDYSTLSKSNRDGFELHLRQLLESALSVPTAGVARIRFETLDNEDVCIVSVAPSGRGVFAKSAEGSDMSNFWVRIGNQTKQLHGDDMVAYMNDHWG